MLNALSRTKTVLLSLWICCLQLGHAVPTNPCPGSPIQILFVNNCNPPITPLFGSGTYDDPYTNLFYALSVSEPCDVIYVFPGSAPYDANSEAVAAGFMPPGGPYQLQANQRLLGTSTEAFQFCNDCDRPVLMNSAPTSQVVQLASTWNNEVSGFTINVATGQEGIRIPSPLSTSSAITQITQNVLNMTGASSGIRLQDLLGVTLPMGLLSITDNVFTTTPVGLLTSIGINLLGSLQGTIQIADNSFSPTGLLDAFNSAILVSLRNSQLDLSIAGNDLVNPSILSVGALNGGIFVNNTRTLPGTYFVNTTIASNTIQVGNAILNSASGIAATILDTVLPTTHSMCLSLYNNQVSTPSGTPGYALENRSFDGALRLIDQGNVGSYQINPILLYPTFPLSYTYGCPDMDALNSFLFDQP